MYTKYYKLQVFFLCIGGALMLLAFFGVVPLICKVFAGICFILVTFFYYQIMSMLAKVTDKVPSLMGTCCGSREPLRQIVQQPILLSFPDRNKLAFGCILPYDYSIISINLL